MTLAGWRWKVRDGSATPAALDAADAARKPKIRSRGVFPRFVCTRIYRLARDHPIPLASSTYKGAHSTPPLMSLGRGAFTRAQSSIPVATSARFFLSSHVDPNVPATASGLRRRREPVASLTNPREGCSFPAGL